MNEFHDPGHETLARRALDRNRLLEGENPDSLEAADAFHWATVYSELIGFKQVLLAEMRKGLGKLPGEAATEIRTVDMAIIRRQLERYESCRAFWERRGENLTRQNGVVPAKSPQPLGRTSKRGV